jgi:hypothetical protein
MAFAPQKRFSMKCYWLSLTIMLLMLLGITAAPDLQAAERHEVLVVVGAAGDDSFGKRFLSWATTWRTTSERAKATFHSIGLEAENPDNTDKKALQRAITTAATNGSGPLWIVLIGHGTYDGRSAKFNLRGPDVATDELAEWLNNYPRPVVLLNNAPASAPFLQAISHPGRVIISATKSGSEGNATRFGGFVAEALMNADNNSEADLDHDGQVSVLEIFLSAAHAVEESYKKDGLLATEHPLIDDNGDGKGTRADWFQGVWATKTAADNATPDGIRAHQIHLLPSATEQKMSDNDRKERDVLENELALLRTAKKSLSEADYYHRLEAIMVKLAQVYARSSEVKPLVDESDKIP